MTSIWHRRGSDFGLVGEEEVAVNDEFLDTPGRAAVGVGHAGDEDVATMAGGSPSREERGKGGGCGEGVARGEEGGGGGGDGGGGVVVLGGGGGVGDPPPPGRPPGPAGGVGSGGGGAGGDPGDGEKGGGGEEGGGGGGARGGELGPV